MNPEQMLDEAIANGDLEGIKKARELIKQNQSRQPNKGGVKFVQNNFNPQEFDKFAEVKEAKKFDKKHKMKDISERTKRKTTTKVVCMICGKTDEVSKILARQLYKCNDCITGKPDVY